MKTWHKGMIIGGAALAVLVPAGLVAADQMGPGNGQGRGNGSMNQDCDRAQMQAQHGNGGGMQNGTQRGMRGQGMGTGDRIQARDGTGARHAQITATTTTVDG
jgi:hypothetical protein